VKIYWTDTGQEPVWVDDLAPIAAPAPVKRSRRLRNWQKFMLCYTPCMAGGALILYDLGGPLTALIGLLIWLVTCLIIAVWANNNGTL
jgi:hypothetical protein